MITTHVKSGLDVTDLVCHEAIWRHARLPWILLAASVLLFCRSAGAQFDRGWIEGSVREAQGIDGVRVSLSRFDGRERPSSLTDSAGNYRLIALPPGDYEVRFQKSGYSTYVVRSVRVYSGHVSVVDLRMENCQTGGKTDVILGWRGHPVNPWETDPGTIFIRQRLMMLPSPRNIWALLENQDPSSVTTHTDEGGIDTGVIALVGRSGTTWTQNSYRLDGINVTDPYDTGKPLVYPDFGSLEEFQAATAFQSALSRAPGASFGLASREGGARFHIQAEAYYLGEPFQSSNLDARLRGFGFTDVRHFRRLGESQLTTGGPLPRSSKWSFFTSLGAQHLSKVVPDFEEIPTSSVFSGLLRFDGAARPQDHLSLTINGQIVKNSHLGVRPGIAPSSTLHGNDRFEVVQGHWSHHRSERTVWDLGFGFSHASPTDTLQEGVTKPNYSQLFTGEMSGAAPLESDSALSRFSLVAQIQTWQPVSSRNWRNRLDYGIDLDESLATEDRRVFQGVRLLLYPRDVPAEVVEYNSPSHAMQRLRELSLFLEDRLRMSNRLFLRFGLNLDASSASLPPQGSGPGAFVPAREFSGVSGVVSWTSLAPRMGVVIPLPIWSGSTRLFAGYSRYYHLLPASYADFANANSLGGRVFRWDDKNHDNLFEPGEEGTLLRVFGGPYSSVDPSLKRPLTDEWGLGLEQNLGGTFELSLRLFRRDVRRLIQAVNVGVPASAFVPVKLRDPGNDNIVGSSDDQVLTVYNQDPHTLGQDRFLLTNPAGLNARSRGLKVVLRTSPTEKGFLALSFSAYKAIGRGNPGNSEIENDIGVVGGLYSDPNTLLNSIGRLYFDRAYVGKIIAYHQGPLGLRFGSVISYFDGLPFGRKLIIPDFSQGPFFVMATPRGEPGGFRTQYNLIFDQRISHDIKVGRVRMSLMVDIFNLLNLNKNLQESDISGPSFSLRKPLQVENPRVMRFGLRWNL